MKSFVAAVCVSVVACLVAASAHAGSCHGTPPMQTAPVQESTPVEPTHVGVSVDVETPSPAGVATAVVVNGQEVTASPTGEVPRAGAAGGGDVSLGAAVRNARREKRATIREAADQRRAGRFSRKASEAAAEAAVNDRVRRAYE
jgi:hypothetical protein